MPSFAAYIVIVMSLQMPTYKVTCSRQSDALLEASHSSVFCFVE